MSSEIRYEVKFQPWDHLWELVGPVGVNGRLLFHSAREAANHARWNARAKGGTIKVYDQSGDLFKTIEVDPDLEIDKGFILPSI